MSWSINRPEDWEPYEAEIYSLYIDKNWTLKRTMKYMEENRGLRATLVAVASYRSEMQAGLTLVRRVKQYKSRFSKKKNLTTSDWIEVGTLHRKRARDGKETEVLYYGRAVDPKRVKRELGRHELLIARAKTPG